LHAWDKFVLAKGINPIYFTIATGKLSFCGKPRGWWINPTHEGLFFIGNDYFIVIGIP
jgi:hypothetical protein